MGMIGDFFRGELGWQKKLDQKSDNLAENYRNYSDGQLVSLARDGGFCETAAASQVLRERYGNLLAREMIARNIR